MTFISRRMRKGFVNVGDKMVADMEEVKRRAEEGNHRVQVKKGSVDGMSNYQRKQYQKKIGVWQPPVASIQEKDSNGVAIPIEVMSQIPEARVELPRLSPNFREAHYVLTPLESDKKYVGDLIVLNYVFLDSKGRGYRQSFCSEELMSFKHVLEHLSQKSYCLKLAVETRVWKGQNLYLDEQERSILLGDRYNPRDNKLTLVQKL